MTTASAPRGTGPPVAIDVAVPDSTGRVGAVPQAITSSFSITRTGEASPAEARSAERTAKPSTLERSNGGTSIGATTSSASAQPSASASGRFSLGTARGNNAASKRASASSRDRMVRNWSCSILSRSFGEGVLVIRELISVPQHIGIDRAARRKSFASRLVPRARLRRGRWRRATIRPPRAASRHPRFRSSSTISAMPTLEAILRASGRLTVLRGRRPERRSSTGSASVHHAARA